MSPLLMQSSNSPNLSVNAIAGRLLLRQIRFLMKKLFGLSFVPLTADLGLLFFRVVLSALVIRFHGWGKLTGWKDEPKPFA
jgi:hypothetical protein